MSQYSTSRAERLAIRAFIDGAQQVASYSFDDLCLLLEAFCQGSGRLIPHASRLGISPSEASALELVFKAAVSPEVLEIWAASDA